MRVPLFNFSLVVSRTLELYIYQYMHTFNVKIFDMGLCYAYISILSSWHFPPV